MKKLFKTLTAVICLSIFTACGNNDAPISSPPEASGADTASESFTVGIIESMEHPAMDSSREGFMAALADNGFTEGANITYDYKNAQSVLSNLKTIGQKFISDEVDMIFAQGTQAAQAVATDTKEIPIVISAVTDPESAGLVKSNEKPETNVTGASDLTPIKEQFDLIKKILPDAKTAAIFFCSQEDNSYIQATMAEEAAAGLGIETTQVTFADSSDMSQVAQSLVGNYDFIYTPTDNTVANAMTTLASVAIEANMPLFAGEEGMTASGGLATVSISYYELGYKAGEMAASILKGEGSPADMPIAYAPNPSVIVNKLVAD
ncbi:MAG: ABC transporter substrate-binding protein, partial [Clostridiales bacterium]|nr:ABC transporter substrate-binding protein [Clostridiales bacterium]